MIEHKSEENNETEDKNLTEYELIWKKVRNSLDITAKEMVPQLYDALIKEGYTPQEAREKIKKDSINVWKKETIDKFIPAEAKQEIRVLAGKEKGKTKQDIKNFARSDLGENLNTMTELTDSEIQKVVDSEDESINTNIVERPKTFYQEPEQIQNQEKEYNVTIFFAGKDIQLKVIATNLKKIIPPNKYVSVVIN